MNSVLELEKLHEECFGEKAEQVHMLRGDGSSRSYYRFTRNEGSSIGVIGVDFRENRAFLSFCEHFGSAGYPVPKIYGQSKDLMVYFLEDLGNSTLFDAINTLRDDPEGGFSAIEQWYKQVIDWLPRFQCEAGRTIDYSLCYQEDEFGRKTIEKDLRYFQEQFLDVFFPDLYDERQYWIEVDKLIGHVTQSRASSFLYRDFQSRNIMLKDNSVYFIDFQSGRRGAVHYDIASLVYDPPARLPVALRKKLVRYYVEQLSRFNPGEGADFYSFFTDFAWIRLMQAMAAFSFLGLVKKRQWFLSSIQPGVDVLEELLTEDSYFRQLPNLFHLFERMVDRRKTIETRLKGLSRNIGV